MKSWYLQKEGLGIFLPHDKVERFKPLLFPYGTGANVNIQGMASACETGECLMRRVHLDLRPVKQSLELWGDEKDTPVPGLQQPWWAQYLVLALLPPATPPGMVVSSFVSLVDDEFAKSCLSSICCKVTTQGNASEMEPGWGCVYRGQGFVLTCPFIHAIYTSPRV